MVGIAIIGIISAMVVAYAGEPRANTKSFAASIVAEMDAARTRAISTRRWNRISFDTDLGKMITEQSTVDEDGNPHGMKTPEDDEWEVISKIDIPKTITVFAMTDTCDYVAGNDPAEGDGLDDYVTFKPDGTGTAATVYLQSYDLDHQWRVYLYRATGTAYAKEEW